MSHINSLTLLCPETKTPLTLADISTVQSINNQVQQGILKTLGGVAIVDELSGALLTEDDKYAYPIRRGIPILIREEAIELIPSH